MIVAPVCPYRVARVEDHRSWVSANKVNYAFGPGGSTMIVESGSLDEVVQHIDVGMGRGFDLPRGIILYSPVRLPYAADKSIVMKAQAPVAQWADIKAAADQVATSFEPIA